MIAITYGNEVRNTKFLSFIISAEVRLCHSSPPTIDDTFIARSESSFLGQTQGIGQLLTNSTSTTRETGKDPVPCDDVLLSVLKLLWSDTRRVEGLSQGQLALLTCYIKGRDCSSATFAKNCRKNYLQKNCLKQQCAKLAQKNFLSRR